jgi:catalase
MSETHTAPSLVSDRISRIENTITKTTPQTSIDIKYRTNQVISSIDSDLSGPTQPIYQSTPKSIKQKYDEDAGHESEDELSDPKQHYDTRRRTSKTRLRDFSQSTSQPIDGTSIVQRTISKFNETDMENVLSHVPTSKGWFILFFCIL